MEKKKILTLNGKNRAPREKNGAPLNPQWSKEVLEASLEG